MLQNFAALLRDFQTINNEELASIYKKWQGLGRISKERRITKGKAQVARFVAKLAQGNVLGALQSWFKV